MFRGELNVEQLEQQGKLSLKVEFDSISVSKLYAKIKKLNGELLPDDENVLSAYEEDFSKTTSPKVRCCQVSDAVSRNKCCCWGKVDFND